MFENTSDIFDWYNKVVRETVDKFAPAKTCSRSIRCRMPWYDDSVHQSRRERRRKERKWRKSRSEDDRLEFIKANKNAKISIINAKTEYYGAKLRDASTKEVFQVINRLLNNQGSPLPSYTDPSDLSNKFAQFFVTKIRKIREVLNCNNGNHPESYVDNCIRLRQFREVSVDDVKCIISKSSNSSCLLDPEPTWLLKQHLDLHLPVLTEVVNSSLRTGTFPANAHTAMVSPLLKKPSLCKDDLKNYRPVSNLHFTAKIIEKCVAAQFVEHLNLNQLMDPLQSAYRACHSTETALIKVKTDIMSEIDSKRVVLLTLLDLSAAFDTVDHDTLIGRLEKRFAVSDTALQWFTSYLKGWKSQVNVAGNLSESITSEFGVPQGSVMGPLLFTAYIRPISDIAISHGIRYHIYADDTQLYTSFNPCIPGDMDQALSTLTRCINDIKTWMSSNCLKLNDSKTEFFVAASPYYLRRLPQIELTIGTTRIKPSEIVRNLGVMFNSTMSLSSHVNLLRRSINFQVRNLWRIRRFIDQDSCHHAVRALVSSRLDYCNGLFTSLSGKDLTRLQRLQNSAARLVFAVGRRTDAADLLKILHWLPLRNRILFKILLYVFKSLQHESPNYISDYFSIHVAARTTRSSSEHNRLAIPIISKTIKGEKRFNIAATMAWNSLPIAIKSATTTSQFKSMLKTHLFP